MVFVRLFLFVKGFSVPHLPPPLKTRILRHLLLPIEVIEESPSL